MFADHTQTNPALIPHIPPKILAEVRRLAPLGWFLCYSAHRASTLQGSLWSAGICYDNSFRFAAASICWPRYTMASAIRSSRNASILGFMICSPFLSLLLRNSSRARYVSSLKPRLPDIRYLVNTDSISFRRLLSFIVLAC